MFHHQSIDEMSDLPRSKGELFRYADSAACVAFEFDLSRDEAERRGVAVDEETSAKTADADADASASKKRKTKLAVVAVGGLTDGFFALPYLPDLAELLKADGKSDEGVEWSLITPLLSSSHRGWGTSSLDRDADELLELSAHLKAYRGVDGIALLGHSTGCQDAVRYAERERGRNIAGERAPLLGVVLQAPVSDRECFFLDPEAAPLAQRRLDRCREAMKEDKDPEATVIDFMTEWDGAPLSAARWFSLTEKGGDDDYFSSDFSDAELSEKLWALGGDVGKTSALPTLIIASLREQYLPKEYDTAAHARRLADAINRQTRSIPPSSLRRRSEEGEEEEGERGPGSSKAEAVALGGDHALRGAEAEAARVIFDFISTKCLRPPL